MKYSLKGSTHEDIVTRIFENRNVSMDSRNVGLIKEEERGVSSFFYEGNCCYKIFLFFCVFV